MPNMDNGRLKVLDYLKENNLTMATLAVQYNMARQDVTNILNGKLKNPQAHRFVARVIEDFKIRQKGMYDMKTAIVKMFKERPNGDLNEFVIELTIPSRRRYGAVIREYIERYNAKNFSKIYFYEVLKLEIFKNQKGEEYETKVLSVQRKKKKP